MVALDFTKILEGAPVGHWIALSEHEDRIVATAVTLKEAIAIAKQRGEDHPVMMKAPPPGALVL